MLEAIQSATLVEWIVASLILLGSIFALIGSIGLWKLRRLLHAPARPHQSDHPGCRRLGDWLADLFSSTRGEGLSMHELLITIFLFIDRPSERQYARQSRHARAFEAG